MMEKGNLGNYFIPGSLISGILCAGDTGPFPQKTYILGREQKGTINVQIGAHITKK